MNSLINHFPDPTHYDNGIETNIYDIARQIFSKPPQDPCTIQLVMAHEIPSDENLTDFEFNLMGEMTLAGLKILFGQDANPVTISETDFRHLNKYIRSMGYDMKKEVEETSTHIKCKVAFDRFNPYKGTSRVGNLDHLRHRMTDVQSSQSSQQRPKLETPGQAIDFIEQLLKNDPSKENMVLNYYRKYAIEHPEERQVVINLVNDRFGLTLFK